MFTAAKKVHELQRLCAGSPPPRPPDGLLSLLGYIGAANAANIFSP